MYFKIYVKNTVLFEIYNFSNDLKKKYNKYYSKEIRSKGKNTSKMKL